MQKKQRRYWFMVFLPMVFVTVMQFICTLFVMEIAVVKGITDYSLADGDYFHYLINMSEKMLSSQYMGWAMMVYSCVTLVLAVMWHKKATGGRVNDTSVKELFKKVNPGLFFAGAFIGLIGLNLASTVIMELINAANPSLMKNYEELLQAAGLMDEQISILLLLSAIVVAPIVEEFTFRGLTFGYARSTGMSVYGAIFLQAFLFGVLHGNVVQGSYAFIIGLFLGYLVYKTQNLWSSIIIHIGFNFFGILVEQYLPAPESLMSFFLIAFGSMVACYGAVLLVNKSVKAK